MCWICMKKMFKTQSGVCFKHTKLSKIIGESVCTYYPITTILFHLCSRVILNNSRHEITSSTNISICILYYVNSLFLLYLISITLYPLILSSTSTHPPHHHTIVCVHEFFFFFARSLHPTIPPELSACFVSMSLSLLCLSVYFVH